MRTLSRKLLSQSAFVRGFIDDRLRFPTGREREGSQSAFVRGFIDDSTASTPGGRGPRRLNPRSCAALWVPETLAGLFQ